jgi:hypothetical protein
VLEKLKTKKKHLAQGERNGMLALLDACQEKKNYIYIYDN